MTFTVPNSWGAREANPNALGDFYVRRTGRAVRAAQYLHVARSKKKPLTDAIAQSKGYTFSRAPAQPSAEANSETGNSWLIRTPSLRKGSAFPPNPLSYVKTRSKVNNQSGFAFKLTTI